MPVERFVEKTKEEFSEVKDKAAKLIDDVTPGSDEDKNDDVEKGGSTERKDVRPTGR